jgi:polyisoprenoid-binding protein YceI
MAHKPVCAGDITATFKRSDYGMMTYLPMVGDQINIFVPVEAIKN